MREYNMKHNLLHIISSLLFGVLLICCTQEDDEANNGSLNLNLSTDYSITTETKAQTKAQTEGPTVNDFMIAVYDEKGSNVIRKWETVASMPDAPQFPAASYLLKASYGTQHTGAFETPYYEGVAPFVITRRNTSNVQVVCRIANTKVTLEYADGFKQYFKDWTAKVASTGDSLLFTKDETRAAYFEPGQVGVNLTLTRQNGKTLQYEPPVIHTEGGKHYRVRLDVTSGGAGGVNLIIRFDKETEEKPIYIDISGDSPIIVAAPFITPIGFSNGVPVAVAEGASAGKIYTLINARGKIKSCILRTQSSGLKEQGWPETIDLANTEADVSKLKGITFTKDIKGTQMAEIDFTNLIPLLPASSQTSLSHTFSIEVTDETDHKNEEFALLLQTTVPGFKLLDLEDVDTSNGIAQIRFEMTSGDPSKMKMETKNDYGIWSGLEWKEIPKLTNVVNVYKGVVNIKVDDKKEVRLNYNNGARISNSSFLYGGNFSFELEMADGKAADVTNPYVWATKAYVKVKADYINPYKLSFRKEGEADDLTIEIQMDNSILIKNLDAGALNTIIAVVKDGRAQSKPLKIKTEDALQLPNSGFENWDVENTISNVTLGGKSVWAGLINGTWYYEPADKINVISRKPQGWATTNKKTAAALSLNLNSWYVVPTVTNLKNTSVACVRNVAWDYVGEVVKDNTDAKRALSVDRALRGTPIVPHIKQKSIGRLFLGDYSCSHDNVIGGIVNEDYKEGLNFGCRPTHIEANYVYNSVGEDKAIINVQLKDENDIIVGKCILHLQNQGSDYKSLSGKIEYIQNKKVQKICVMIAASSLSDESKISTKANSDYSSNNQIKNKNFYENALTSTGSELYIDDLKLIYE